MNMNIKKSVLLILSLLVAVFPYGISPVLAAQVAQAPVKIVDIEAGLGYSVALLSDGTVWVWGDNENGLAGDGTLGDGDGDTADNFRTRPALVMGNVKSIGGTYNNCYAITNDNSLWVWGFGHGGRVGNGGTSDCSLPVKVLSDVKCVASGNSNHSAAVKNDGSLWVWGLNLDGQLLNGSKKDQLTPRKIMSGVKSVASGEGHLMVLKGSDLYVWGRNWKGQLGDGTGKARLTPFKLKTDVKKIYAGSNQSYFITNDGTLWGAGKDFTGKYSKPVRLMTNVTDVNASPSSYVAVKTDGTLWSSGLNDRGQLGTGDTKNRTRFAQIKALPTVQTPAASDQSGQLSAALVASGRLQLVISLDGNLTGWKDIGPVGSDPAGDVAGDRFDITDLYAVRDEKYLYIAVKASGSKPDLNINIDTDGDGEGDFTALCYVDSNEAFIDDEDNKADGHIGVVPLSFKKAVELKIPLAMLKNPAEIQIAANYNKDDNGDDPDKDWMNEWCEVQ